MPDYSRYSKKIEIDYQKANILMIVNNLKIKIIDIDELLFQKSEDPLVFFPDRQDNHYNILGYKNISEIISLNIN